MENQLPIPFVPRHAEVVYHNEHPRILTSEDARLFFKLMIPLQYFVCKEDKVLPNVLTQSQYHNDTSHTQKIKVVQTLYTKPIYFSKFIEKNPNNFSQEELDIIKGWRDNFVWANFILERYMKRSMILMYQDNVYAAVGITTDLRDMLKNNHPIEIVTAILPFKGNIIIDGLVIPRQSEFGPAVRCQVRKMFVHARNNNKIQHCFGTYTGPRAVPEVQEELQWNIDVVSMLDKYDKKKFCTMYEHTNSITDQVVNQVAEYAGDELEEVDLSYCDVITDAAIETLAQKCKNIRVLKLESCVQLTSGTVSAILKMSNVRHIDLTFCENIPRSDELDQLRGKQGVHLETSCYPSDYYFSFNGTIFMIVSKRQYDKSHRLDYDRMSERVVPPGFEHPMPQAVSYIYNGDNRHGKNVLIRAGFTENKKVGK